MRRLMRRRNSTARARQQKYFALPIEIPWGHRQDVREAVSVHIADTKHTEQSARPFYWPDDFTEALMMNDGRCPCGIADRRSAAG